MAYVKEVTNKKGTGVRDYYPVQFRQVQSHVPFLHQVLNGGSKPAVLVLIPPQHVAAGIGLMK